MGRRFDKTAARNGNGEGNRNSERDGKGNGKGGGDGERMRARVTASRQQQQLSTNAAAAAAILPSLLRYFSAACPFCQCCCYVFVAAVAGWVGVAGEWWSSRAAGLWLWVVYGCVGNPRQKNLC